MNRNRIGFWFLVVSSAVALIWSLTTCTREQAVHSATDVVQCTAPELAAALVDRACGRELQPEIVRRLVACGLVQLREAITPDAAVLAPGDPFCPIDAGGER